METAVAREESPLSCVAPRGANVRSHGALEVDPYRRRLLEACGGDREHLAAVERMIAGRGATDEAAE